MDISYNFKGEVVKEYENVNSAIRDLYEYIKNDLVYEKYLQDGIKGKNDEEIYCINHIKAIKRLIEEYKKIKEEMEKLNK